MLRGGRKSWYIGTHIYTGFVYAQIPSGLTCLCLLISGVIPSSSSLRQVVFYFAFVLFGVAWVSNFIQPSFLTPAWLRWLETKHGDILPILKREAQNMGLDYWEQKVKTQEDLEKWVDTVRSSIR